MPNLILLLDEKGTMCGSSGLSRLVDVVCKNGLYVVLLKAFFRPEVDSDVNMPKLDSVVRGEQEPCVE